MITCDACCRDFRPVGRDRRCPYCGFENAPLRRRRGDRARQRAIEASRATAQGKRFFAFYHGVRDCRRGRTKNPFKAGGEQARCWEAGRRFAGSQE